MMRRLSTPGAIPVPSCQASPEQDDVPPLQNNFESRLDREEEEERDKDQALYSSHRIYAFIHACVPLHTCGRGHG